MCSNLIFYQLKTNHIYTGCVYANLTVITKQKLTKNTQEKMTKKSEH